MTFPFLPCDVCCFFVVFATPTHPQVAELTRLSQTLMLVPNLHWLVAEDAVAPTRQVLAFLDSCSVPHTYLLGRLPGGGQGRGVEKEAEVWRQDWVGRAQCSSVQGSGMRGGNLRRGL